MLRTARTRQYACCCLTSESKHVAWAEGSQLHAEAQELFTAGGWLDIPTPRALTTEEVRRTVTGLRFAARCANEAGADGGLTEPLVGSATSGGMLTTCRREGDVWLLNGQKKWTAAAPPDRTQRLAKVWILAVDPVAVDRNIRSLVIGDIASS